MEELICEFWQLDSLMRICLEQKDINIIADLKTSIQIQLIFEYNYDIMSSTII